MVSSLPPTSMISGSSIPDLSSMSSSLNGSSASSARASSMSVDDPAREALRVLDDLLHALLELGQILGREGPVDLEVVVEAVLDRRADAELRLGELLLHRLREHVSGGVPDDAAAVLGVGADGLDLDILIRHPGEVRSAPSASRTTTIVSGPLSGSPASRTAAPALVPAGTRTSVADFADAGVVTVVNSSARCLIKGRRLRVDVRDGNPYMLSTFTLPTNTGRHRPRTPRATNVRSRAGRRVRVRADRHPGPT